MRIIQVPEGVHRAELTGQETQAIVLLERIIETALIRDRIQIIRLQREAIQTPTKTAEALLTVEVLLQEEAVEATTVLLRQDPVDQEVEEVDLQEEVTEVKDKTGLKRLRL